MISSNDDGSGENDDYGDIDLLQFTPTQSHFLKKYLIENQLTKELHRLNDPECCQYLGPPFKSSDNQRELPLLSFFFQEFIATFPFVTNNSSKEQQHFWQDVLQPFVETFNSKDISDSEERKTNSKRKKSNKKLLSGLLVFYNTVLITSNEMMYLNESHLKASDTAKLDKFDVHKKERPTIIGMNEFDKMKFENGFYINIVAVRKLSYEEKSWFFKQRNHHYEFIIQIVRKLEAGHENYFILKYYDQFKKLENDLNVELPGVMSTKLPSLPHKDKNDIGYDEDSDLDMDARSGLLSREKLRLALRGYLRLLIKHKEIVNTQKFLNFISSNKTELTESDIVDYEERINHERIILQTQIEFQDQTAKLMVKLSDNFENFKLQLIKNPNTITKIFEEIGSIESIKDASPLLQTFNDWCKLEIAATVYQIFLGQDNSNEIFQKCKRFHRLFPYSLIYGILRFTNPMKMVSRIVDLLFVNIPRLPSWNRDLSEESKKTGARNLCSLIFIMLLNEDLNEFSKEVELLKGKLNGYELYMERIENYTELTADEIIDLKEEAIEKHQDLVITILSTSKISPLPDSNLSNIIKSFNDNEKSNTSLYSNLKQYWLIQVRRKDKQIFKELWQEPQLTRLLKSILQIFYNPLMRIFAKSNIHLAFSAFQDLIDDLLKTLSTIREDQYFMNPLEIYDSIKSVLDQHEEILWNFLHDVYVNDDQHIFLKLILWLEKFLTFMRLKFTNEDLVKLNINIKNVNRTLFMQQLNSQIDATISKRKIFKQYLQLKDMKQDQLDQDWDEINNGIFGNTTSDEFGIKTEDIEDINNLTLEDKLLENNHEHASNLEQSLLHNLKFIDQNKEKIGTWELDKIDITLQIEAVINNIKQMNPASKEIET
ncbi:uncharacterized protein KGF55_003028 [Candida pseudojiufengensis]|uniref:uncharacterized protein n=1 Tax=Candida pseudojiufengensis TaxID=497109 RepID=UPI002224EA87|nr:uncharacterized protein KGF55_003028 [Candida pseudojiufengensis]KAI5963236.1 hypothetical protein KGF55_003028 [Candida pseudojiufengensis]